jgi:hypothetical protein
VLLAFLSIPAIPVEPSDGWKHPLNMIFVHANVYPSPSEVRGRNSVRRWFPGRGGNAECRCVKNYETWGAVQCSAGSEDGIGVPEANGPYSLPRDEELDPCLERLRDVCGYTCRRLRTGLPVISMPAGLMGCRSAPNCTATNAEGPVAQRLDLRQLSANSRRAGAGDRSAQANPTRP